MCAKTFSTRPGEGTGSQTVFSSINVCVAISRFSTLNLPFWARHVVQVHVRTLWISAVLSLLFVWMSVYQWGVGVCLFLLAEHTCLKGFSPPLNSSTIPPSLVSREAETWGSCRCRRCCLSCSDPACLLATGLFGPGPGSGEKQERNRVAERKECWGRD